MDSTFPWWAKCLACILSKVNLCDCTAKRKLRNKIWIMNNQGDMPWCFMILLTSWKPSRTAWCSCCLTNYASAAETRQLSSLCLDSHQPFATKISTKPILIWRLLTLAEQRQIKFQVERKTVICPGKSVQLCEKLAATIYSIC